MRLLARPFGAALLLALALPLSSGVGALLPSAAAAATVTVTIGPGGLDQRDVTVPPGSTVTWVNADQVRHRVRSTSGAQVDSGNLEPGQRFSATFPSAGTTSYLDDRNRDAVSFHGTVTVRSDAPDASPSPPPTTGSGGEPSAGAPAPPGAATVTIGDRSFSPTTVRIATGGTVTWSNTSGRDHTATADGGAFDTGTLAGGGSASRSFPTAGTFTYHCDIHPDMTGSVEVGASGTSTSPASPTPASPTPGPAPSPSPTSGAATPAPAAGRAGSAGPTVRSIAIREYEFAPATVEAHVGDTVEWTNVGRAPHTATAPGAFDTGRLAPGGTGRFTPTRTGTFPYGCTIHPEMAGIVRVVEAATPVAAPTLRAAGSTLATPTATAAAGGAPPTTEGAPAEDTVPTAAQVDVRDYEFAPAGVRIRAGGTVTWTFTGAARHSVTGDGFDSGVLGPNASFDRTFEEAGTFAYRCVVHPEMTGTVEVLATGEDAPPPTGPAARAADLTAATPTGSGGSGGSGSGTTQAWLVAFGGGAFLLGGTGLLLVGARRFLLAAS